MNSLEIQSTESVIGFPVTRLSRSECKVLVKKWIAQESSTAKIFACANPHSLHVAGSDTEFHKALLAADLLTPDGVGIVIGSRILGGEINERITGNDVFDDTCALLNQTAGSCFFLGSTEEVLGKIRSRMAQEYPNVIYAGDYSPPFCPIFTEADNAEMINRVNRSSADVLWVGMTAPKQEKWLVQNQSKLNVKFAGAIGAVFDFYAETVPRSSLLSQRLGVEWLPRLLRQPRRLWRRNFVSNPSFVIKVLKQRIGLYKM